MRDYTMPVKVGQKGAEGAEENHGGAEYTKIPAVLRVSASPCPRVTVSPCRQVTMSNAAAKIVSASAISASVTTSGGIQRITLS